MCDLFDLFFFSESGVKIVGILAGLIFFYALFRFAWLNS